MATTMENIVDPCNIWKQQCKIPISGREKLCPSCNGRGGFILNASFKSRKYEIKRCVLCDGEGKVDWITAITKKSKFQVKQGFFFRIKKYI